MLYITACVSGKSGLIKQITTLTIVFLFAYRLFDTNIQTKAKIWNNGKLELFCEISTQIDLSTLIQRCKPIY